MIQVGDTVVVSFTATVERVGVSGDRVYVYAGKHWLKPEEYERAEEATPVTGFDTCPAGGLMHYYDDSDMPDGWWNFPDDEPFVEED